MMKNDLFENQFIKFERFSLKVEIQFVVQSDNENKIYFQGQVQRPNVSFESTFLFCSLKATQGIFRVKRAQPRLQLFSAII